MFRFIGGLVVLALVVVAVTALVRGWVQFGDAPRGETGATVTINKAKIEQDVATVKNKVKKEGDDVKGRVGDSSPKGNEQDRATIQGKLQTIGQDAVTLARPGDQPMTVRVTRETDIRVGGKQGTLADLRPGDSVTVGYVTLQDRPVARSLQKD
jgi:hypothetical protein